MQVFAMARAFGKILGQNFWLGSRDKNLKDPTFSSIFWDVSKSYALAWRYMKFAKEKEIESFYCREGRILLFAIFFNKLFFRQKIKFIYESHRVIESGFADKFIERTLSFFVDKYIFVTLHLRDIYVQKYRLKQEKTFVAPDGVDFKIFDISVSKDEARNRLNLPQGKKILGYCGRFKTMGEDKGFLDILESLKFFSNDVIFVAMGGKPKDVESYQKIARDIGVSEQAFFRGHEIQETVALYQKAFDVLLMPFPKTTHYMYYMSPMKMFEYMAGKRPIVASDLPSVREVLNESNAVIVEPGNPESLAVGIKRVLDDEALAQKISEQAYEDAKKYKWDERAEKILDFIQ